MHGAPPAGRAAGRPTRQRHENVRACMLAYYQSSSQTVTMWKFTITDVMSIHSNSSCVGTLEPGTARMSEMSAFQNSIPS